MFTVTADYVLGTEHPKQMVQNNIFNAAYNI